MDKEKQYISAILACVSAIIFLVYYIRDLHKKYEERTASLNKSHEDKISELYKHHEERLSDMYKEGLKTTHEVVNAINRNSDTIDRTQDLTEKNNATVNELYKFLIARNKK